MEYREDERNLLEQKKKEKSGTHADRKRHRWIDREGDSQREKLESEREGREHRKEGHVH